MLAMVLIIKVQVVSDAHVGCFPRTPTALHVQVHRMRLWFDDVKPYVIGMRTRVKFE